MAKSRPEKPMVTLMVEKSLLDKLDDFRYRRRFPTRTEAMKYLWLHGLDADPEPTTADRARLKSLAS